MISMMTKRSGDPMVRLERVLPKVQWDNGCWILRGKLDRLGYGRIGHTDGTGLAHRAVYIALIGDPGSGVVLDHLCRNTSCVNPWHMSPTTVSDNVSRGANKRDRPNCKQGHPYTTENTFYQKTPTGRKRVCATCSKVWTDKYKASK